MTPIIIYIAIVLAGLLFIWRAEMGRLVALAVAAFRQHPRSTSAAVALPEPSQVVYAVGACDEDDATGAWAYVRGGEHDEQRVSGVERETTRVRIELTAAIRALESITPGEAVTVRTDTPAVAQGMTQWVQTWARDEWRTGGGQEVSNRDLWQRLYSLNAERTVRWEYQDESGRGAASGDGRLSKAQALAQTTLSNARKKAGAARPRDVPVGPADTSHAALAPEDTRGDRRGVPPGPADDSRAALLALSRDLEQRWAETYVRTLAQDQEWQRLVDTLHAHLTAMRAGQSPQWSAGALAFLELGKHATRLSDLTTEALKTCDEYARTLQRTTDAD